MRRSIGVSLALVLVPAVFLAVGKPSASHAQEEVNGAGIVYTYLEDIGPDADPKLDNYLFDFENQGVEPFLSVASPEMMRIFVESGPFYFEIDQGEAFAIDPDGKLHVLVPREPDGPYNGIRVDTGWTIYQPGRETICFWCLIEAASGQLRVSVASPTIDGKFSWTAVTKAKDDATPGAGASASMLAVVDNLRSSIPLRNPSCQGRT
jgi:hypothetical protein